MVEAAERHGPDAGCASARTLDVEVWFDFICPWCLIGKRNLDTALGLLAARRPDVAVRPQWHSQLLLPGTPAHGLPYVPFYRQRLGGAAQVAMRQAQVREAAQRAGATIAFERIEVLPSTLGAHRLVAQARREARNGGADPDAVVDALFHEYFVLGHDIGRPGVLQDVAARCGVAGDPHATPFEEASPGAPGVPFFRFGDTVTVQGAQPPDILLEAMELALRDSRLAAGRPQDRG